MHSANERAEGTAIPSALDLNRLAGRIVFNPSQEVTMVTHITPGAVPAIDPRYAEVRMADGRIVRPAVIVMLSPERHPDRYRGELQQWVAYVGGAVVAAGQQDPEHNACRTLLALGIKGTVLFVHSATGTPGLAMDIERGAGLTTAEGKGLRVIEYVPFSARRPLPVTDDASGGVPTGDRELQGHEQRLTDRALLDGEAL